MSKFISIFCYLISILFIFNGLMWLINPSEIAMSLGMQLLTGHGLSTQIGDLASFFLVVGIFTFLGVYKKNNYWFYTPIALLAFAAISRVIAFLAHGASLSIDKILVELVLVVFLLFVVNRKEKNFS